jgi:hypothetical protein
LMYQRCGTILIDERLGMSLLLYPHDAGRRGKAPSLLSVNAPDLSIR